MLILTISGGYAASMKYIKKGLTCMMLMLMFVLVGCSGNSAPKIAEVNGEELTHAQLQATAAILAYPTSLSELRPETASIIEDTAFNYLVLFALGVQYKSKQQTIDMKTLAKEELLNFKQSSGMSEDEYEFFLEQNDLDEKALSDVLMKRFLFLSLMEEVTADITATDEEVAAFAAANHDSLVTDGGMEIYHILVATEEEAEALIAQLQNGGNFAALAQEHSSCSSSAQGGYLGICNESSNFVEEFKTAALALNPGEMTLTPVKSQFGYHIIQAGNLIPEQPYSTEQIKELLISNKKQIAFDQFIREELQAQADIKDLRSADNR